MSVAAPIGKQPMNRLCAGCAIIKLQIYAEPGERQESIVWWITLTSGYKEYRSTVMVHTNTKSTRLSRKKMRATILSAKEPLWYGKRCSKADTTPVPMMTACHAQVKWLRRRVSGKTVDGLGVHIPNSVWPRLPLGARQDDGHTDGGSECRGREGGRGLGHPPATSRGVYLYGLDTHCEAGPWLSMEHAGRMTIQFSSPICCPMGSSWF